MSLDGSRSGRPRDLVTILILILILPCRQPQFRSRGRLCVGSALPRLQPPAQASVLLASWGVRICVFSCVWRYDAIPWGFAP
jgi:hypothetical protein